MGSLTNQPKVEATPKPDVQTFEQNGNVCFTKPDAKVFFDYVYTLETEIEDAQKPY